MALLDLQGMKAQRTAADSGLRRHSHNSKHCGHQGGGSRLSVTLC